MYIPPIIRPARKTGIGIKVIMNRNHAKLIVSISPIDGILRYKFFNQDLLRVRTIIKQKYQINPTT
jgi:hypothetical protein